MSFLEALAENPLLLSALLAGLMASVASGVIGTYVVAKRIVFISGSISHAVLGGIGIALWLQRTQDIEWLLPLHGALVAAILSALIMGWIRLRYHQREDSVIAAVWSIGMAIGILFISQTPGYNVELTNFLVGNILWVAPNDLIQLAILDIVTLVSIYCLHKKLVAVCFDEVQARLQGLNVPALYLFLLVLTAVSIVLLIQVVGIILVMTMLTIPAAIAAVWTGRLSTMMAIAVLLSAAFCFFGTAIAYHFDWPPGATIALAAGVAYVLVLCLKKGP